MPPLASYYNGTRLQNLFRSPGRKSVRRSKKFNLPKLFKKPCNNGTNRNGVCRKRSMKNAKCSKGPRTFKQGWWQCLKN